MKFLKLVWVEGPRSLVAQCLCMFIGVCCLAVSVLAKFMNHPGYGVYFQVLADMFIILNLLCSVKVYQDLGNQNSERLQRFKQKVNEALRRSGLEEIFEP